MSSPPPKQTGIDTYFSPKGTKDKKKKRSKKSPNDPVSPSSRSPDPKAYKDCNENRVSIPSSTKTRKDPFPSPKPSLMDTSDSQADKNQKARGKEGKCSKQKSY